MEQDINAKFDEKIDTLLNQYASWDKSSELKKYNFRDSLGLINQVPCKIARFEATEVLLSYN